MGKKHKIPTRECIMKNLKKLSASLDNSPCCQVKAFPCCACTVPSCFNSGQCGRKCFLVPNFSVSRSSSNSQSLNTCGPYPSKCVDIFSPCSPFQNTCPQNPTNCCCGNCRKQCCNYNSCYSKPRCFCNIPKCRRHICNRYRMPTFQFRSCCCQPATCCHQNHCRSSPPCKIKFRKCPAGNLCCRCHTICLPRCFSDTTIRRKRISGKSLRCSRSVELRGSVLYRGCDCDRRNGLQDRCLRYCCINNPKCRLNPAECHCSKFSCGKHLAKRYRRKKCRCSYSCYVCKPPQCTEPLMPCYPATMRCCCRKQSNKCDKKEEECQCCPSMEEAQCLCSLKPVCIPKQTSMQAIKVCCRNTSPCPSHCLSPCVSPCPSPCSVECSPCCFVPQSLSNQENFCSCCSASCQRLSPHNSSNCCRNLRGQTECICTPCNHDPESTVHCVSCNSPYQNFCNY